MAPSTPSRTRKSTAKKRTRQERSEEDEETNQPQREDLDLKSPQAKKRNTAKTPTRKTSSQPNTPVTATRKSSRRGRASQALPQRVAEEEEEEEVVAPPSNNVSSNIINNPNSLGNMLSRMKSSMDSTKATVTSTIESFTSPIKPQGHEDEKETKSPEAAENGDDEDNEDTENAGFLSKLKTTMSDAKATVTTQLESFTAKHNDDKSSGSTAKAEGDADAENTDTDKHATSTTTRQSDESFYRGRKFLWYCLLLCTFLAIVCGVLWASVVTYDLTDYEMELSQCKRSLASVNRQLSAASGSAKDKYYLQELEKQVQHWKKQAKQNEAFAQGYKAEYQAILKQLEGE